jgi:exodeoxyribonuclease VII large subunit
MSSREPELFDARGYDVLSIGALYNEVESALVAAFPRSRHIWVRGEIQTVRVHTRSGHCYLDLIDPDARSERGGVPILRVKCWRTTWGPLSATLAHEGIVLEPGMVVTLRGQLDFYRPNAEISFILAELDVTALLGRLAAKRAELLRALAKEGLLAANKKVLVPELPLHIGLVASPGTEGYRDFVGQLSDSGFAFSVTLVPVSVQGEGAPTAIARAIRQAERVNCDVIVLVRGGGSKSDLGAFDSAPVARAIARCPHPVWTGIGHTGDESVADIVANRSFITPTECGSELGQRVAWWWNQIADAAGTVLLRANEIVQEAQRQDTLARHRLVGNARQRLRAEHERLLLDADRIARCAPQVVDRKTESFQLQARRLPGLLEGHLERTRDRLDTWRRLFEAYDVDRQLERGYTLTLDANGQTVRSAAALEVGASLVTRFADGTATSTVDALEVRSSTVTPDPVDPG